MDGSDASRLDVAAHSTLTPSPSDLGWFDDEYGVFVSDLIPDAT